MPSCAVVGCYSGNSKENSCQAFNFPDCEKTCKVWLEQLNRKDYKVTKNSRLCIRHFAPEAFIDPKENVDDRGRKRNRLRLKLLAFPTLEMRPSVKGYRNRYNNIDRPYGSCNYREINKCF